MNATPFRTAMRLFAAIAIVAVLAPIGRGPAIDVSTGSPQASAKQTGFVVLAQGRCINGHCFGR